MADSTMGDLTTLITFISGLSVATERVTEVIKGIPFVSSWLAIDKADKKTEEARKATVQFLAIAVGGLLAYLTFTMIPLPNYAQDLVTVKGYGWIIYPLCGVLASGGSGLWNSALDIVRETNKQKQILSDRMKAS